MISPCVPAVVQEDVLDGWGKLTERSKKGKGAKKAAMKAQSAVKSKSVGPRSFHVIPACAGNVRGEINFSRNGLATWLREH